VNCRDLLINSLAAKDIHCGIHYPIPLHLQEAYNALGLGTGAFPVSEKVQAEFVSLPMYPEITKEQIHFVTEAISESVSATAV